MACHAYWARWEGSAKFSSLGCMTFAMPRALFRGPKQGFSLRSGRNDRLAAGAFSRQRSPRVMTGAAETVEIGRHDDLDRGRDDVEAREGHRRGRDDVVALEELDLVRGQRRVGEDRHQPRLEGGEAERYVDKPALAADLAQQQLEELAEGVHFGTAELVGVARRRRILEAFDG